MSLKSWFLITMRRPACHLRLTWIVLMMGGKWRNCCFLWVVAKRIY